jgi:hypothetical protein
MQYNAVYLYLDVEQADYDKYLLPLDAPANPMDKDAVIVPLNTKKPKLSGWMFNYNSLDDVGNKEDDDIRFITPKCNKITGKPKHQKKKKTTINPDLVFGAEFRKEGVADDKIDRPGTTWPGQAGPTNGCQSCCPECSTWH